MVHSICIPQTKNFIHAAHQQIKIKCNTHLFQVNIIAPFLIREAIMSTLYNKLLTLYNKIFFCFSG